MTEGRFCGKLGDESLSRQELLPSSVEHPSIERKTNPLDIEKKIEVNSRRGGNGREGKGADDGKLLGKGSSRIGRITW
jgi:hypothetical protein